MICDYLTKSWIVKWVLSSISLPPTRQHLAWIFLYCLECESFNVLVWWRKMVASHPNIRFDCWEENFKSACCFGDTTIRNSCLAAPPFHVLWPNKCRVKYGCTKWQLHNSPIIDVFQIVFTKWPICAIIRADSLRQLPWYFFAQKGQCINISPDSTFLMR